MNKEYEQYKEEEVVIMSENLGKFACNNCLCFSNSVEHKLQKDRDFFFHC